jgi:2-methylcitrate dehydratase PrpD
VATLGAWCAQLQWRDVPHDQRALVPLRVLDTLGLIAAGTEIEATRAALGLVRDEGGSAAASLLLDGSRRPAARCALVHGIAAHCRDFDDTFPDSVVHPGSVVVPAALAAGEGAGAAPADIGTAIVAGYELAARIGAVAGRRFHARGLHATGVVGPLAAAGAAARARGLAAEQAAWAIGLAASMAGGLMAFQADGAWSKWLHAGWAAQGGVMAADLAARGFRGPLSALDGPGNLFGALLAGEAADVTGLAQALGADWRGGQARFKHYPCAHVIQPYLDAALSLRREQALRVAEIAEIRCAVAPWAKPIVCEPRAARVAPATELDAIASLPYMVAYAFAAGEVTLEALAPVERERADIRALAARLVWDEDPAMDRGFPARVTVRTRSGASHTASAEAAGVDAPRLVAKFVANAAPRLGRPPAEHAAALLCAMPAPDPVAIASLFRAAAPASP